MLQPHCFTGVLICLLLTPTGCRDPAPPAPVQGPQASSSPATRGDQAPENTPAEEHASVTGDAPSAPPPAPTASDAEPSEEAASAEPALDPQTALREEVRLVREEERRKAEEERRARTAAMNEAFPAQKAPDVGDELTTWARRITTTGEPIRPLFLVDMTLVVRAGGRLVFLEANEGDVVGQSDVPAGYGALVLRQFEGLGAVISTPARPASAEESAGTPAAWRFWVVELGDYAGHFDAECWPVADPKAFEVYVRAPRHCPVDDCLPEEHSDAPCAGWFSTSGFPEDPFRDGDVLPARLARKLKCPVIDTSSVTSRGVRFTRTAGGLEATRRGELLWRRELGADAEPDQQPELEAGHGVVYVYGGEGAGVRAFARRSGRALWSDPTPRPRSMARSGLYEARGTELLLRAHSDGSTLWKHDFGKPLGGVLATKHFLTVGVGPDVVTFELPSVRGTRPDQRIALATRDALERQPDPERPCVTTLALPRPGAAGVRADLAADGRLAVGWTAGDDAYVAVIDADAAAGPSPVRALNEAGVERLEDVAWAQDGGLALAFHSTPYGTRRHRTLIVRTHDDLSVRWETLLGQHQTDRVGGIDVTGDEVAVLVSPVRARTPKFAVFKGPKGKKKRRSLGNRDRSYRVTAMSRSEARLLLAGRRAFAKGSEPKLWWAHALPDGRRLREKVYGAVDPDVAVRMAPMPDGGSVLAANVDLSEASDAVRELHLLRLDADGGVAWQKNIGVVATRYALAVNDAGIHLWHEPKRAADSDPSLWMTFTPQGSPAGEPVRLSGVRVGDLATRDALLAVVGVTVGDDGAEKLWIARPTPACHIQKARSDPASPTPPRNPTNHN